jgi:hypothetical protein
MVITIKIRLDVCNCTRLHYRVAKVSYMYVIAGTKRPHHGDIKLNDR